MLNLTLAADGSAPLAILSPLALFERQCVIMGVDPMDNAQRELLKKFFFAGMELAPVEAGAASARYEARDKQPLPAAPDVDKNLREAARKLISVRGRLSPELNYAALVRAYDTAADAHGESPAKSTV